MSEMVNTLPLVPLRDVVVLPGMRIDLPIGRPFGRKAIESALAGDQRVFLLVQRGERINRPGPEDLGQVGTIGKIVQRVQPRKGFPPAILNKMFHRPEPPVYVTIEGLVRGSLVALSEARDMFDVVVKPVPRQIPPSSERRCMELSSRATAAFADYVNRSGNPRWREVAAETRTLNDPGRLADIISSRLAAPMAFKQRLLEITEVAKQLEAILDLLEGE
jgi:ATP-dependent Lon protease